MTKISALGKMKSIDVILKSGQSWYHGGKYIYIYLYIYIYIYTYTYFQYQIIHLRQWPTNKGTVKETKKSYQKMAIDWYKALS